MKPTLLATSEPTAEPPSESLSSTDDSGPGSPETIRCFSERLIAAQRPLRILDAINWDEGIERDFFAAGCRQLPRVARAYYDSRPLPFDPATKRGELAKLALDISQTLGKDHPAAELLLGRCRQYQGVVDLLEARGTEAFAAHSGHLFGTSRTTPNGGAGLLELARGLAGLIGDSTNDVFGSEERNLEAGEAATLLSARLGDHFRDRVCVRVETRLASDASAGAGYLKLRAGAMFSPRDLRLLEVHEGWVHLGTTLNGLAQPICSFLSRPMPAATVTQEGLAVLVEVLAFASHPDRLRRLAQRVEAVALVEEGASFLDVYRHFVALSGDSRDAYRLAARTFRGSLPDAGPFTKDLSYSRGLVELCGYLRTTIQRGQARTIPLLFAGKVSLDEIPLLARLVEQGLVAMPKHLPPPFADLRGLCAWLCCAGWLASAC